MATENVILKYVEMGQRMEIARSFGITSRVQVWRIAKRKCKSHHQMRLLEKLEAKAQENRQLLDRVQNAA